MISLGKFHQIALLGIHYFFWFSLFGLGNCCDNYQYCKWNISWLTLGAQSGMQSIGSSSSPRNFSQSSKLSWFCSQFLWNSCSDLVQMKKSMSVNNFWSNMQISVCRIFIKFRTQIFFVPNFSGKRGLEQVGVCISFVSSPNPIYVKLDPKAWLLQGNMEVRKVRCRANWHAFPLPCLSRV